MALGRAGKIAVDIVGDATGLKREVNAAIGDLHRLNRSGTKAMAGLKTAGLAAGAALGTGLSAVLSTGVREILQFEKVAARTANVIETTGSAAGITAKQVEDLANQLQALTGTEDDVIQAGENVLLTFTKVGAKDGVFARATAAANDMSVAMGKDMTQTARGLGKALQDPEKGLGGLTRAGVTFTAQEKETLKALVASGHQLEAQKLILKSVETRYKGAAQSEGNLTEKTQQANRQFEEFSQTMVGKFVPAALAVFRAMNTAEKATDRWRVAIKNALNTADQAIKDTFNRIVAFLGSLDGRVAKAAAAIGQGIARGIGGAAKAAFTKARDIGIAIVNGIVQGIKDAAGRIASAVSSAASAATSTSLLDLVTPATGGFIPGRFDAKDDVPAMLSRGEVVLNPSQQRMVGIDRIVGALSRSGGLNPGLSSSPRFAAGGYVTDAYQRATSKLGTAYNYGVWDCSKFATYVAGVNVGGTTASAYPDSSPAKGSEPIVWGFRKSHSGGYRGGPDEHMGVRVSGRWFDNGGGGVQSDANSTSWQEVRVPHGLENLGAVASNDTKANTKGTGHPMTALQRLSKMINLVLGKSTWKGAGDPRNALVARATPGVGDVSGGLAGSSLSEGETRAAGGAGRAASEGARKAGLSPEAAAAAGTEAERNAEVFFLNKHLGAARESLGILASKKRQLLADYKRIAATHPTTAAGRAAKLKLLAANRAKRRAITAEMADVRNVIEDIRANLADIGEQAAAERYQVNYDLAQEKAAADAADAEAAKTLTPDQQAQLDQATNRAATAQRGLAISDSFVRTILGSGSIDPGGGSITVNINTLHPGDPQIQGEIASWVVGALGGQGSVPTSAYAAGV